MDNILEGFHLNRPLKNYDFSGLYDICEKIIAKDGRASLSDIGEITKQLNKFFTDCKCTSFTISDNTDKMFYGAKVVPNMHYLTVNMHSILFSEDPIRITEYDIDMDGKLFNPLIYMTPNEMIAILLHEIGHVVNTAEPIDQLRVQLDNYCANNNDVLSILQSDRSKDFMAFGMAEFISKHKSMFEDVDNEYLADEFVHYYGFDKQLDEIRSKIAKNGYRLTTNEVMPFSSMLWTLRTYKDLGSHRLIAVKTLNKAKSLSGSLLLKRNIDYLVKILNRADTMRESAIIHEGLHKFRINTMKQFEDEYFEIAMRVKNVEEEDDALYLMRKINTRISVLDDFINTEKLSPDEMKRWNKVLDKYKDLREKLSNVTTYKNKSYGLYVNYPAIR